MHAALDKSMQAIVEAEDLKLQEVVDTYGYVCHGHECGIQVFPRSYRAENLLRAHFYAKVTHVPDCDVSGEEQIRSKGKKRSVAAELEKSPGLSPASLKLIDKRVTTDEAPAEGGDAKISSGPRSASAYREPCQKPAGRRAANSIRPICRAFIEFPYDRHLALQVSGVQSNTYQTVFKVLRSTGIERLSQQRIFYGELSWTAAREDGDKLVIPLNAGEWIAKKLTPYTVVVEWKDWTQTARSRLINELKIARKENMDAKKQDRSQRTYLFFLGQQNMDDLSQFTVNDLRLICTVHGELAFPKTA